ncbi:MAG: thiamine pyrophosphate-dependent enzyme [Candidatus Hodarchaeota archaeon]
MDRNDYDMEGLDIAWCPGCGNFSILKIMKNAFAELDIPLERIAYSSGIGQAAKFPQYIKCNYFNGLHGRSLPVATAIKAVNPDLTVIAESGDGCNYGEGGNHFIHTIRRNPGITHIVHDNMIYGLTKGQASPTTMLGVKTPVQVDGVILEPFNPLAVAIALNASFVARAYAGDQQQAVKIVKRAIQHDGYALVDMLQPCPSFNKVNTYQWYKENTYYLGDDHDEKDREKAMKIALNTEKLALGVIYTNLSRQPFEKNLPVYKTSEKPIVSRGFHPKEALQELIDSYR